MLIYRGSFSVFSTSVEVIPWIHFTYRISNGILHECGGDPLSFSLVNWSIRYSPRVWRWSYSWRRFSWGHSVFSTSVEVILLKIFNQKQWFGILHECGGDPAFCGVLCALVPYSPRVWRWSFKSWPSSNNWMVFSTSVEVIQVVTSAKRWGLSILHTCGG